MDEYKWEEWKEKCRRQMAEWNTKNIQDIEMFKSVIMAGQAAIKSAILINGGAAVASGVVYLTQLVYSHDKQVFGHVLNGISWLLVISCYILFVRGAVLAFRVF